MLSVKIGDICTWSKGFQVPRNDTSCEKEIPYLHYGDLYKLYGFKLNLEEEKDTIIKISNNLKFREEQMLHDGDIVFTLTSETTDDLGHCTLIINPLDRPFVSGMETTVIHITDKTHILPSFLNYLFQSEYFQRSLRQYVTGMKVYRVHPNDLMNMTIELPEYSEQAKIVEILDSISNKININHKINDNLVNLINFCFEKISSNSTDSVKLGKIADVQTGPFGSQLHQEDYVTDGTPLVSVENLGEFHLNRKHLPRVSSEDCARLTRYIMDEGDIIFSRVGYVDRSSYVSRMENGWMFSGSCLRIRNNDPIYALYTYFYLNTRDSKETFRNIAIGATRPSINSSILLDFEIKLPSKSEMEQFNKIAKKIELVMTNNALKIEKLMMMRDCLLPKLLSGEIDVSNLSIAQLNNHLSNGFVRFLHRLWTKYVQSYNAHLNPEAE